MILIKEKHLLDDSNEMLVKKIWENHIGTRKVLI